MELLIILSGKPIPEIWPAGFLYLLPGIMQRKDCMNYDDKYQTIFYSAIRKDKQVPWDSQGLLQAFPSADHQKSIAMMHSLQLRHLYWYDQMKLLQETMNMPIQLKLLY